MAPAQKTDAIDLDGSAYNRIHIIGIGGAGMSAIATVLTKMGKNVSGSDLKSSQVTERLISGSVHVTIPHDASIVTDDIELVVRSTAISDDNEEITAARGLGIRVASRAEMLSAICAHERSVGIAGSHGKTTTTSMVTSIGRHAHLSPSFMIGGDLNEIGTNASYTSGSLMVVEADESDRTFLDLALVGAVVTNIENDHLENYHDSFEELKESFFEFVHNVDGPIVICVDEPNSAQLAKRAHETKEIVTVGESATDAQWKYSITDTSRGGISAKITCDGEDRGELTLAVPGVHNIKNALCAFALMSALGVSDEDCHKGLSAFGGVARRFQFRGHTRGITFVDDYAHLPTEIEVTLAAARDGEFSNVIAIFQPHRYSRTEALHKEFAQALRSADIVAICEIYSAGEDPREGVTGTLISNELSALGHDHSTFVRHVEDVIAFVDGNAQPGDLVLTLGAGDVTMYPDVIQKALADTVVPSE